RGSAVQADPIWRTLPPTRAHKIWVDSSSMTAATWHEHVDATRTLRMVGTQTPLQEKSARITQRVTLHGISWQTYIRILTELGDKRASRLEYAQGVLEIPRRTDRNETYKKLRERMIETFFIRTWCQWVRHRSPQNLCR